MIARLVVTLSSLLLCVVLAEAALRIFLPIEYRKPLAAPELGKGVWSDLVHRSSSVPGLGYELVPNTKKRAMGTIIRTNSYGMRDAEPAAEKDESLVRIAAIGDSFTFGFGVGGESTYPNVLERLLAEAFEGSGIRFEVLNFGVGGYSTRDEALVLEHKAMAFEPDLVVVGYVHNDPETDPIQPLHRHFHRAAWWEHSHVARLLAKGINGWQSRGIGEGADYVRQVNSHAGKRRAMKNAMRDARRTTSAAGIELVVVIFPLILEGGWSEYAYPDLHELVAAHGRDIGARVIDLLDVYRRYPEDQVLGANGHPTVLGHLLAARAIRDLIQTDPPLFLGRDL
jgi:lysophospholipase L1-like esterase